MYILNYILVFYMTEFEISFLTPSVPPLKIFEERGFLSRFIVKQVIHAVI